MTPISRHRSSRRSSRDIDAVDGHGAVGGVVEARDEVDQRRLAAAGAADDRRRLAGLSDERDVVQDGLLGARVTELDVLELDARSRMVARPDGGRWQSLGMPCRCPRLALQLTAAMAESTTVGSVSRTSRIRAAETTARGRKMIMKMAIRTENRICIR